MKKEVIESGTKFVKSNNTYSIVDIPSGLINDKLPNGIYKVEYNDFTGFSLIRQPEIDNVDIKLFGDAKEHYEFIESLNDDNGNIFLSGRPGMGKTMILKKIMHKYQNSKVIIVLDDMKNFDFYIKYFNKISNAIYIIDEFVKKVKSYNNKNSDSNKNNNLLLTWLDGTDNVKKRVIVADNYNLDSSGLSFVKGRQNRIEFVLNFGSIKIENLREYFKYYDIELNDNTINTLMNFNLNYDNLNHIKSYIKQYGQEFIVKNSDRLNINKKFFRDVKYKFASKDVETKFKEYLIKDSKGNPDNYSRYLNDLFEKTKNLNDIIIDIKSSDDSNIAEIIINNAHYKSSVINRESDDKYELLSASELLNELVLIKRERENYVQYSNFFNNM